MGSLSDLRDHLRSRYSSLSSFESIKRKDGSSFILIRPSLTDLFDYLPNLYVVVELGLVKLLSYHGKILREEKLEGGYILERFNKGKLFMCPGIENQNVDDSYLKDVYTEPSKYGEIIFRSRSCSFLLENTPGHCPECQSLLTSFCSMESDDDDHDDDDDDDDNNLEDDNLLDEYCLKKKKKEMKSKKVSKEKKRSVLKECPDCLKVVTVSSLPRHLRRCQRSSSLVCQVCLQKFTRKGCYNRHFNLHIERMNLDEAIQCPICRDSLENRRCLNEHMHESHDSSKGCCGICLEVLPNEMLSKHFERRHNYSLKKHICNKCGLKFKFPCELNNHIACIHDVGGEKSVVCDQCGRVFPHRRALTTHMRMSHNKTKIYPCQQCDSVFFENCHLKRHLPIHAGVKPFKCSRCEHYCVRKDNVLLHIRRVHKIAPTSEDVITISN